MKKIISLIILSVILTVSTFAVIPASADDYVSRFADGVLDNVEQAFREYYNIPATDKVFCGSKPDGSTSSVIGYFVVVHNFQQARFVDDPNDPYYIEQASKLSHPEYMASCMEFLDGNGDSVRLDLTTYTVNQGSNGEIRQTLTNASSVKGWWFRSDLGRTKVNGIDPTEFDRVIYNMLQPPDVFTYTINPTNFTLKNGGQGNITVDITSSTAYTT